MSTWRPITGVTIWKRWLPVWMHAPVVLLFQVMVVVLILILGVCFFYYLLASRFDLDEVGKLPRGNVYYDRLDQEIEVPNASTGKLIDRDEIPDFLVQALMAREDARFYDHGGVDVKGLARATLRNIKDRDFTQGASTLSMQLARNTYEMRAKSLHRKFLEIALTLRVESRYSKDEILTSYLSRIYFGSGAYGIDEAAQTYFGKEVSELHPGECAMVVGIIRGPHIFSPLRNLEAAMEQRDQTLARMVDAGFITQERAEEVEALEIVLNEEGGGGGKNSYIQDLLDKELEMVMNKQDAVLSGLKIYTTLDSGWQKRLETELSGAVGLLESEKGWSHPKYVEHRAGSEVGYIQYAAVTTETKTGAILAYVGGRDISHSRIDRTRMKRDLGSAFEPFVAAAAAERGKLVLPGRPVQTGRQIGPAEVERLAKRCGITGPFLDTEDLFRGAVAATTMEMSVGLATLGNSGKRTKPYLIRKVTDSEGSVLFERKVESTQALSAEAAKEAIGVLEATSGTRTFTGATGSEREAWVMRLGPSGSTAIWIGFDVPKKIANESRLNALLEEFVKRLGN